jgi:DNA-binding transcriptional regulator YiaG
VALCLKTTKDKTLIIVASSNLGLSARDAAMYLGVTEKALSNWRALHIGPPCHKDFRDRIVYCLPKLEEWIAANATGPATPATFPVGRISARETARYLGVTEQTLANWRRRKIGPPWKALVRHVWYWLADLDQWAATRGITPVYVPTPLVAAVEVEPPQDPTAFWARVDTQFPRPPQPEMSRAEPCK